MHVFIPQTTFLSGICGRPLRSPAYSHQLRLPEAVVYLPEDPRCSFTQSLHGSRIPMLSIGGKTGVEELSPSLVCSFRARAFLRVRLLCVLRNLTRWYDFLKASLLSLLKVQ